MNDTIVHLGMDDIDSPSGGCTTHFTSLLVERLNALGVRWLDYPKLIRLNPNIPFRTRGNGSVALHFSIESDSVLTIMPLISEMLSDYVEKSYPNTNPGVVLVRNHVPQAITEFSESAVWRVVPLTHATRLVEGLNLEHYQLGTGRGIVGALAAIGNALSDDHTYEYLTYRSPEDCSQPRGVDSQSVYKIDQEYRNLLFSNIDYTTGRIMIEPHGPDPVLFGVRGEDARTVIQAGSEVRSRQPVSRWLVFRSNQGTGQHLSHTVWARDLRPYMATQVEGFVTEKPHFVQGGHVLFKISDDTGDNIPCAVYEPTGDFRKQVIKLEVRDLVRVHAGVRPASRTHGLTLNVEGLEVLVVSRTVQLRNPVCPDCSHRMKSAGKGKGFKCPKCGHRDPTANKMKIPEERTLEVGLYLPPANAQRHLTRPAERLKRMNSGVPEVLVKEWHRP